MVHYNHDDTLVGTGTQLTTGADGSYSPTRIAVQYYNSTGPADLELWVKGTYTDSNGVHGGGGVERSEQIAHLLESIEDRGEVELRKFERSDRRRTASPVVSTA